MSKLGLDEKIVVGKVSSTSPYVIRNRYGTAGFPKLVVGVDLPSYSLDGKLAIVKVSPEPGRMPQLFFLTVLEKVDGRWKVRYRIK